MHLHSGAGHHRGVDVLTRTDGEVSFAFLSVLCVLWLVVTEAARCPDRDPLHRSN